MLVLVALLALVAEIGATAPSCAILFAGADQENSTECAEKFNQMWLNAAQDEAVRVYHTLDGGYLPDACTRGPKQGTKRIEPLDVNMATLICLDPHHLPCECAYKKCNYRAHPELFDDDKTHDDEDDECDDGGKKPHKDDDDDKSSCRKLSSWLRIGIEKVSVALDLQEAGEFDSSTSYACAAELVFGRIAKYLDNAYANDKLVFLNSVARDTHHYEHLPSPVADITYPTGGNDTNVQLRLVQSVRKCTTRHSVDAQAPVLDERIVSINDTLFFTAPLSSVLVYSSFDGQPPAEDVTQVGWAVAGTIPPFEITLHSVAPDNLCAIEDARTTLEEFDETRRFPQLTPLDWANVLGDGAPRSYIDLQSAASCPAIVLLEELGTSPVVSLTQLNLRSPIDCQDQATFGNDVLVAGTWGRLATGDECLDVVGAVVPPQSNETTEASVLAAASFTLDGDISVPLTMAPGESRCSGGQKAGDLCTMESECGAGWACRRKPFVHNVAYCYDGVSWDEARACAFADADDECPFGECVGDVNGLDGGAYPFLYFYKENNCEQNPAASPVCADPHVADWHQYPNELIVKASSLL